MKTLYLITICDEDAGEAEGMFDEKEDLLTWWHGNDGSWVWAFDDLLAKLGYKVETLSEAVPARVRMVNKLKKVASQ